MIRSFPLNSCLGDDERPFLQFFSEIAVDGKFEKIIGWALPDLIFEAKYPELNVFIDCTFSCCPKGYSQCLIFMIYSVPHDLYIPVFYVLMTAKKKDLYNHVLQSIISAADWRLFAKSVTCDFEPALLEAVGLQFREANLIGCAFHWKQALRRKLLEYDIPDDLISLLMDENGLINLLTVIPIDEIESKGIPYIRAHFPEGTFTNLFNNFWKYFSNTWLKRYDPKVEFHFHELSLLSYAFYNRHGMYTRFAKEKMSKLSSSTEPTTL